MRRVRKISKQSNSVDKQARPERLSSRFTFGSKRSIGTPQLYENRKIVVPPYEDPEYAPVWHNGRFSTSFNSQKWNRNLAITRARDVVWPVNCITGLRTQVVDGEVRELIQLSWQRLWVPLSNIKPECLEQFGMNSKTQDKAQIEHLTPNQRHWAELCQRFRFQVKFPVHRASEVKPIHINGKEVAATHAYFADTLEHSSQLGPSTDLFYQLYERRIRHADEKIQSKNTTPEDQIAYASYLRTTISKMRSLLDQDPILQARVEKRKSKKLSPATAEVPDKTAEDQTSTFCVHEILN